MSGTSILMGASQQFVERLWWQTGSGLSIWIYVFFLAVAVVIVSYCYFKLANNVRYLLAMWMCRVLAIVLTALAAIDISIQKTVVELPELVIAVDKSLSLAIADRYDTEREYRTWFEQTQRQLQMLNTDKATRLALAKLALLGTDDGLMNELSEKYRLFFYSVGDRADGISGDLESVLQKIHDLKADDQQSRLGESISQIVSRHSTANCAGILFFSDGAVTEGISLDVAARQAASFGIPIYCVGLGSENRLPDFALSDLQMDENVFPDDLVRISCSFSAVGLSGQSAIVSLKSDTNATPMASQTIQVDSNQFQQRLDFELALETIGQQQIRISVEPHTSEARLDNNHAEGMTNVMDRTIRVLLIYGYPSPEYRFLNQVLRRTTNQRGRPLFEVNTLLLDASANISRIDDYAIEIFPVDLDSVTEYDVVILGDTPAGGLTSSPGLTADDIDLLWKYVDANYGSIVLIAGPRYLPDQYHDTPLGQLFPFRNASSFTPSNGSVRFQVTRAGQRFEPIKAILNFQKTPSSTLLQNGADGIATMQTAPRWIMAIEQLKPTALELVQLTDDNDVFPAITIQPIGKGTVVFHALDETYRWRYRSQIDRFEIYWSQLCRYLAKSRVNRRGKTAEISTLKREYAEGEPIDFFVEIFDENLVTDDQRIEIQIEHDNSQAVPLWLNRDNSLEKQRVYRGRMENLRSGEYHAYVTHDFDSLNPVVTQFQVSPRPQELFELRMQSGSLQVAAELTGGQYFQIQNVDQLWNNLPQSRSTVIQHLPGEPIWSATIWSWLSVKTLFATAILLLLTTEWTLRYKLKMM